MEKQNDVLKKMGRHLTKLEETRLKKTAYTEMKKGKVRMKEIRPIMKGTTNLRSLSQIPWP